jgi:hypothetical protein
MVNMPAIFSISLLEKVFNLLQKNTPKGVEIVFLIPYQIPSGTLYWFYYNS